MSGRIQNSLTRMTISGIIKLFGEAETGSAGKQPAEALSIHRAEPTESSPMSSQETWETSLERNDSVAHALKNPIAASRLTWRQLSVFSMARQPLANMVPSP